MIPENGSSSKVMGMKIDENMFESVSFFAYVCWYDPLIGVDGVVGIE